MKMNNKGFTLVELLAVMVILISISLVTVGSITESLVRREEQECKSQMELAINAAKIFCSLNSSSPSVTIGALNCDGYDCVDYFKDDKKMDMLHENDSITCGEYAYSPAAGSCIKDLKK